MLIIAFANFSMGSIYIYSFAAGNTFDVQHHAFCLLYYSLQYPTFLMTHERTFLHLEHSRIRLQTFYRVPHVLVQLHTIHTISWTYDLYVYDALVLIYKDCPDSTTDHNQHLTHRMMMYLHLSGW